MKKVSELFKDYYKDHGEKLTRRKMEFVREKDQKRLKL